MNRPFVGYIVLLALVVLSLVHMIAYYPMLPEKVASHFDVHGHVDGWMGKGAFLAFYAGTALGTALVMFLVGLLTPRLPTSMINLPHKDYWLSPERRKASLASFSGYFGWFASATLAFLIGCFHLCFATSLGRHVPSWLFPSMLGVYLFFTLLWCVGLLLRFRKPRARDNAS
jgi:uncharacterized membrane protein